MSIQTSLLVFQFTALCVDYVLSFTISAAPGSSLLVVHSFHDDDDDDRTLHSATQSQHQRRNVAYGKNCSYCAMRVRGSAVNSNEKSAQRRRKHRVGCSKAEPKNFSPSQTPFPGARDGQNLISWRWSLLLPKTQFAEDRCTQFRVIVVTDPQTNKQTHPPTTNRQVRLQHTAPQLARSVIIAVYSRAAEPHCTMAGSHQ